MQALRDKDWAVHPQVGVSFFRIDLGIVHPDFPGRYLAGVECDGAAYHRSASARDRDRLREMVLTDLGWRIRRIWSTEWWMDSSSAAEKIHQRLIADLEADRASRPVVEPTIELPVQQNEAGDDTGETADPSLDVQTSAATHAAEEKPPLPEPANDREPVDAPRLYARGPTQERETAEWQEIYVKADPASVVAPDRVRFYDVGYRGELRRMVDHVIEIEGPIYFDVLVERVARAHGFQRSGETVQKIVAAALGRRRFPSSHDGDREVVWPQDVVVGPKTTYRGAGGREHVDIPLPELAGLAEILRRRGLEDEEEVIRGMQEHFGLGRLAASTRERFEAALAAAVVSVPSETR